MAMRDLYEVLGVAPDAEDSAVRTAYRKLALRWHPGVSRQTWLHFLPGTPQRGLGEPHLQLNTNLSLLAHLRPPSHPFQNPQNSWGTSTTHL